MSDDDWLPNLSSISAQISLKLDSKDIPTWYTNIFMICWWNVVFCFLCQTAGGSFGWHETDRSWILSVMKEAPTNTFMWGASDLLLCEECILEPNTRSVCWLLECETSCFPGYIHVMMMTEQEQCCNIDTFLRPGLHHIWIYLSTKPLSSG